MPPVRGKPEGVVRASLFRLGFKKPSPFSFFWRAPGSSAGPAFFFLRHGNPTAAAGARFLLRAPWQPAVARGQRAGHLSGGREPSAVQVPSYLTTSRSRPD